MGTDFYYKGNMFDDKGSSTGVNSEYFSKGNMPDDKILLILESLTRDKSNTVFIVTGREKKLVSDWFSSKLCIN
jgi:trehalose-6-phosphatase